MKQKKTNYKKVWAFISSVIPFFLFSELLKYFGLGLD
jgi:hypothetical protein